MDSAIIPIVPLNNRHAKRKFERDAKRIMMPLEEVNTGFTYHLFSDDNPNVSYNGLYQQYLTLWYQTIDEVVKLYKFKYAGIDRLWFERQYKPKV